MKIFVELVVVWFWGIVKVFVGFKNEIFGIIFGLLKFNFWLVFKLEMIVFVFILLFVVVKVKMVMIGKVGLVYFFLVVMIV